MKRSKRGKIRKQRGEEQGWSLKQRGAGGSSFPSDVSVRKKALFRRYDFVISETLRGNHLPPESFAYSLSAVELV